MKRKKSKCVSYAKWGYIFLIPFFLVYIIFQLIPLLSTFYNSFFENYRVGLMQVGPTFVGFKNYKEILFNSELPMYLKNTFIIWMMGFIPQMFFSLLLASWFTDLRLRLKCSGFFKTVIYMPNLIMASAFSMLFYTIFSDVGPINNLLNSMGLPTYRFLAEVAGAPAAFQPFAGDVNALSQKENIDLIMDVPLDVTVELGRTKKSIKDILEFAPGTIVELNKIAGEAIDVLVNGKYVAKGEVVVIEESFGVRITEIIKEQ